MYRALQLPVPLVAYTVLHRRRPEVPPDDYRSTMIEMHRLVAAEAAAAADSVARAADEQALREAQRLQGALLHFLETPMKRDKEEVAKNILESVRRAAGAEAGPKPGLAGSRDALLAIPRGSKGKPLAAPFNRGAEYLAGLGFAGPDEVWESRFFVHGAANLDLLEHVVRDRIGIDASAHGRHLGEFTGFVSAAHNLADARSWGPDRPADGSGHEVVVWFAKPQVRYAEFRGALAVLLDDLMRDGTCRAAAVWQRKLGLGSGEEYQLRCEVADHGKALGLARSLAERKLDPVLQTAIVRQGRMALGAVVA
jgi:hypothetical protein